MSKPKKPQVMKPATAALKLDVYLPATPPEFQEHLISREDLDELQHNPPQWLVELRRDGPHPRSVVAARLRVSNSGLARGGVTEPLTSEQIAALAADPPPWLVKERELHAEVKREERRLREEADAPPVPAKAVSPSKRAAPRRAAAQKKSTTRQSPRGRSAR